MNKYLRCKFFNFSHPPDNIFSNSITLSFKSILLPSLNVSKYNSSAGNTTLVSNSLKYGILLSTVTPISDVFICSKLILLSKSLSAILISFFFKSQIGIGSSFTKFAFSHSFSSRNSPKNKSQVFPLLCSFSVILKLVPSPVYKDSPLKIPIANLWIVEIFERSISSTNLRYFSLPVNTKQFTNICFNLFFILIAASFVNVTIAISSAILETASTSLLQRYAILETIENVFPVPAPASTKMSCKVDACSTSYCCRLNAEHSESVLNTSYA